MPHSQPDATDSGSRRPDEPAPPASGDVSTARSVTDVQGDPVASESRLPQRLHDAATGLAGGAVATVAMTAFRAPISRSPPPPAWFWATFIGDGEPGDYVGRSLLLHLLYGMGGGAAFGALVGPHLRGEEVTRERQGTALGAVYGLVLSLVGVSVILDALLGMDLDDDERYVFDLGHLVYGLSLGTWFGSRE